MVRHIGRREASTILTTTPGTVPLASEDAALAWRSDQVESALAAAVDLLPAGLIDGCRRVIQAGGKRLRPELVIRCADVGPNGSAGAIDAATAVELLHSASLIHDDLLDDSDTRRGVAAIHRREGMPSAVIAGDALIALSWRTIATCDPASSIDLGDALFAMCEGQSREDSLRLRQDADVSDVLRVAALKTGALLAVACRIGARLGGCTQKQVHELGVFGQELGIQLQILDDILDVVSDDKTLGKPTCGDFRAGLLTLPTLFALTSGGAAADRLGDLFAAEVTPAGVSEARAAVLESGAVARSVDVARSHAARAARAAREAGAADLVSLPEQFLQHQLRKVSADFRHHLTASARVATTTEARLISLPSEDWEKERAV